MSSRKPGWIALGLLLLCVHSGGVGAAGQGEPDTLEPPGEATGFVSSSHPALDFRTNGFALPMYLAFLPAAVLLLAGVGRSVRRWRRGRKRGGASHRGSRGAMRRLLALALLQTRMLRRPFSGWMHLAIFWGFVLLATGSFLIMVDSYLLGPLGLSPSRGLATRSFQALMDAAGLALLIGVSMALWRRLRGVSEEKRDAPRMLPFLTILLVMGTSGFLLEGLRIRLEGEGSEAWSFVGSAVASVLGTPSTTSDAAFFIYDVLWWGHAVLAFALIAAIPYSRMRHLFTSPLNIATSSSEVDGALNTPFNLKELAASGSFDVQVGVGAVGQFAPRDRAALEACADSGLCRDVCPAHQTGTPLSPERLITRLRDASEAAAPDHGPALFDGLLTAEEVWSCTLCGACTRTCPVLVDPMRHVVEMRRGLVAANRPGDQRRELLDNLSRTGNPYGSQQSERGLLPGKIGVPTLRECPDVDLLYWIGCAATFDPRARETARAMVAILKQAGVRVAVLGSEECCTGDPARRIGEEGLFQDLAFRNLETFQRYGVKKVLTHCAHCYNTFRNEYPEFGAQLEVVHHAVLIQELIEAGKIRPARRVRPARSGAAVVTLHDSCYVARFNRQVEAPRAALRAIPGLKVEEMSRRGEDTFCCGAGGAQYWYAVPRREKMSEARLREAAECGASVVVSECPYCLKMLGDGVSSAGRADAMQVRDIAEVIAGSLGQADMGERES